MMRIILFVFALFLWFATPTLVEAQDGSAHDFIKLREFVAQHWPKIMQRGYHPEVTPYPTPDQHSLDLRQFNQVHAIATTMLHKYEQRHAQHDDFLSKLDTRRDKMHAEGADISHIDNLLSIAHESHAQTEHVLETEEAKLESLHDSVGWQALHTIVASDTRRLHQAFVNEQAHMTNVVKAIHDETLYHNAQETEQVAPSLEQNH